MSFAFWRSAPKVIPRLPGRVAVVTGAAHGIGRALAIGLRERGCHLALVDVDAEGLTHVASSLAASRHDQRVTLHVADVSDRVRMRELAQEVASAHGVVDVLINSAGIAHEAAFPQTSLEEWDRIIAVNLLGVIHGCHFFLPYLARADRGHIVNLSSLLGVVAMPGQCAYTATKFGVRGFSEALQEELRMTSVGLTLVHPGAVATGIMLRARGDDPDLLRRIDGWYERNALRPDRVAERIIRAIERGTPRLLIGADAVFGDVLKRLLPVAGNALFVNVAIRMLGVEYMRARRLAQWRRTMLGEEKVDEHGGIQ